MARPEQRNSQQEPSSNLELQVAVDDVLRVRQFSVQERLSSLFQVSLMAVCSNPSVDFDAVVGQPARFFMHAGKHDRVWSGLCSHLEQVRVEPEGVSTYQITVVPTLWALTQRQNYRMFQHLSEPDIVLKLLAEWSINPEVRIDRAAYKKRKYRVQYAESDYLFLCRMLEDAGIAFYFEQEGGESRLVLSDAPHLASPRGSSLLFKDSPGAGDKLEQGHVTAVRVGQRMRPGRYTLRDHDYRRPPSYKLITSASDGQGLEQRMERYHYVPGAFLFGTDKGESTPLADAKGKTRADEGEGAILAQKRLDAKRGSAKVCTFETNAHDLAPGMVIRIAGHPRADLEEERRLLLVESSLSGTLHGEWSHDCEARGAEIPFRPELATPKPKAMGVESATVVGPPGEEIHTDEFGRVRVHFHWDREDTMDDASSCWIHVSQPWGGAGYGGINLPRVGQEVLVEFLGGDPDRPIIVGRLYTGVQRVPYSLPANKTQSGWRSASSPGGDGYNELMFEDKKGAELVNLQAERDLHKLVKRDEEATIGHDRTTVVQNDEDLSVGNNRCKLVQMNEREVVGLSRTRTVGVHEGVQVGANQRVTVGAAQSVNVGANQSVNVGGAQAVTVALASAETVGLAKALTVGAAYQISVGGAMNTTVLGVQAEEVGLTKSVTVGQKIEFICGAAKLVLEKSGKVTIEGTELVFQSSGPVGVTGKKITVDGTELGLSASGKAELAGGSVQISGDPIDLN